MSLTRQILGLVGWLLLCFAVAAIGAVASVDAAGFYQQLTRPDWAPPSWLFGPVWTALYTIMAISAWLVWRKHGFNGARTALSLFILQLAANAVWSWLFFKWHLGAMAFADVLLLWMLIVATMLSFRPLQGLAAGLLLPYLAWVSFASALTFSTWRLNPALL